MRTIQRDFEVVISRYTENIDWIIPYKKHCTVYCKDQTNTNLEYIHLPNVGRESHTYLHHIIENYDDLATMTLFSQGQISDTYHHANIWKYGIPAPFIQFKITNKEPHWSKLTLGKYAINMRFTTLTFGQWWDKYLCLPRPPRENYYVQYNAVFSVHRDIIHVHPKCYYEKLISCISDHINPEEGHYFERSWYHIFGGVPSFIPHNITT